MGKVITETKADKVYYFFLITHTFKGEKADTVTILTGFGHGDCGIQFEKGQDYLVFTHGKNETSNCSRTALAAGNPDVAKLKYLFEKSYADDIGKDKAPELTQSEANYFNLELVRQRMTKTTYFDFQFKRVAFFEDGKLKDKQYYFENWGGKEANAFLYILTPEEKKVASGYDAIIVVTKRLPGRKGFRKKLVRRLS